MAFSRVRCGRRELTSYLSGWVVVVWEGVGGVASDELRKRKCAKYRREIRTSPDQLLLQHSGCKITSHFNGSIWRNILWNVENDGGYGMMKSAVWYAVQLRLHQVFYFSFISFNSSIRKIETEGFTETLVAVQQPLQWCTPVDRNISARRF